MSRLLRAGVLRAWFVAAMAASILFAAVIVVPNIFAAPAAALAPLGKDFVMFYAAGSLADNGHGGAAYDEATLSAAETAIAGMPIVNLRFAYPPAMLLLCGAAALPPYPLAFGLWVALGFAALALAAWRIAPHRLTALFILLCPAAGYCAMMGQAGLFFAAAAGGALAALPRRKIVAGALFALLTLKPQLALLVPVALVAAREWKALAAMAAAALALHAAGVAIFGIDSAGAFLERSSGLVDAVTGAPWLLARMPTVFSAAVGLGAGISRTFAAQAVASVAACAAVAVVWRRSSDPAARALAWAAATPLAVPYLVDYDLVVLVVPLAALAWRAWQEGCSWRDAAAMTLLWCAGPAIQPLTLATGVQIGPLVAAPLLLVALTAPPWRRASLSDSLSPANGKH